MQIKEILQQQGLYCYDELLLLAQSMVDKEILPLSDLQNRFPLVLLDEAQDTNEVQSKLLNRIFDPGKSIVQRFGDGDQQIFDFGDKAATDPFPNSERVQNELILNETQRCSAAISAAAGKFSLSDLTINIAAEENPGKPCPYLILFDQKTVTRVIPKFADLVRDKVNPSSNTVIKVVGQIGKDNPEDKKFPHTICHYEPTFMKPADKRIGRPKNLYSLVAGTRQSFLEDGENFKAINTFFSGVVRLIPDQLDINFATTYPFRSVKEKLEKENLNSNGLNGKVVFEGLLKIYNDIIIGDLEYAEVETELIALLKSSGFVPYSESFFDVNEAQPKQAMNQLVVNGVPIELNTIAGIKGETHTATLILETFYRKHNIENAIRAAFGFGANRANEDTRKRTKHLYVAMTRPSDILCIALPKEKYEGLCESPLIKEWFDSSFAEPCVLC